MPLDIFLHVAADYAFFFAEARELGITIKEARQLNEYDPDKEIKYLKKSFPFIELKMKTIKYKQT